MSAERPSDKAPRRSWTDLGPRIASAAVLVPVTAVALYFGGYLFAAAVGAVFAGAYREWETMVTLKPLTPFGIGLAVSVFVAALLFPLWGAPATLGVAILAAIVAAVRGGTTNWWRGAGLVYFGVVVVAVLGIRGAGTAGILAGVLLAVVIWLTDTGAFFTGRQLGGEKLAAGISPGKTRSGAIGGLVVGTLAGLLLWHFITPAPLWIGLVLCLFASILGQLGDLGESALKRRFRIKDSGDLIPGHGGLMDRLDSLTFGALFFYVVGALHLGAHAVAAGLLSW